MTADGPDFYPFQPQNGGRFVSSGRGRHPTRIIDSWELLYVTSGELTLFEAGRVYRLLRGEWLILEPGKRHGGVTAYAPNVSFFWVHFLCHDAFPERPRTGRLAMEEMLTMLFQAFLQEQSQTAPDSVSLFWLLQLLFRQIWHQPQIPPRAEIPSLLAQSAHQYAQTHFRENFTVAELAALLGCNAEYLGKVYLHTYGERLNQSIRQWRLAEAERQLRETNHAIKEIAEAIGYQDAVYFRRCFLRKFGMSPGKLRALRRNDHWNSE